MADTYKVVVTPRAEASLEKIINYLIEEVSYETAEHVEKKLLAAINNLAKMPTKNAPAKEIISKANITYRRAISMSYRIICRVEEDQLMVLVVEIYHTKRGEPETIKDIE